MPLRWAPLLFLFGCPLPEPSRIPDGGCFVGDPLKQPELLPIAARPSGSLVSFTSQLFSTRGSTSVSMYSANTPDIVSYSLPRWFPWASPPPLAIWMRMMGGMRFWAIRLSRIRGSPMSGFPLGSGFPFA